MALKVVGSDVYYFASEILVSQRLLTNINEQPRYSVSVSWKQYTVAENGDVIYDHTTAHNYYSDNYSYEAVVELMGGNPAKADSLTYNQLAVKVIIEQEDSVSLEVV